MNYRFCETFAYGAYLSIISVPLLSPKVFEMLIKNTYVLYNHCITPKVMYTGHLLECCNAMLCKHFPDETYYIHSYPCHSLRLRWINKVTQVVFVCLVCNPFHVGYLFKGLPMLWLEGKLKSVCIQHHHPWCWTWVACQINVTLSGNALAQPHCRYL